MFQPIQSPDHYMAAYQGARQTLRSAAGVADPEADVSIVDLYSRVSADVSADTADGKAYSFFADSADFELLNQEYKIKLGDSIPSHLAIAVYGYSLTVELAEYAAGDDKMEVFETLARGRLRIQVSGKDAVNVAAAHCLQGLVTAGAGGGPDATATAEDIAGHYSGNSIVPLPVPKVISPNSSLSLAELKIDGSGWSTTVDFVLGLRLHCFIATKS